MCGVSLENALSFFLPTPTIDTDPHRMETAYSMMDCAILPIDNEQIDQNEQWNLRKTGVRPSH